jgi:hypothetical protein
MRAVAGTRLVLVPSQTQTDERPEPPFLDKPERAPDFTSESLVKKAARFAAAVPAGRLRAAINSYAKEYKRGRLGDVLHRGLSLYVFACRFRDVDGTIRIPIARTPSGGLFHGAASSPLPRFNFGYVWVEEGGKRNGYDHASHFLPIWNDSCDSARAALHIDSVVLNERTARLMLTALAVLYSNDRAPTRHQVHPTDVAKTLGEGAFLFALEREFSVASLPALGVAASDMLLDRRYMDKRFEYWNDIKPFFQLQCCRDGLFWRLASSPRNMPAPAAPAAPAAAAPTPAAPPTPAAAAPTPAAPPTPAAAAPTPAAAAPTPAADRRGEKRALTEASEDASGTKRRATEYDSEADLGGLICMAKKIVNLRPKYPLDLLDAVVVDAMTVVVHHGHAIHIDSLTKWIADLKSLTPGTVPAPSLWEPLRGVRTLVHMMEAEVDRRTGTVAGK